MAAPVAILAGIALSQGAPGVPPFPAAAVPDRRMAGTFENLLTLVQDGYYAGVLPALAGGGRRLRRALPGAGLSHGAGDRGGAGGLAGAAAGHGPAAVLDRLPAAARRLDRAAAGWRVGERGADRGWAYRSPLRLLYSDGAMYLGMVHAYLPFAVLPLAPRCCGATCRWRRRRPTWVHALGGVPQRDPAAVAPGAAAAFLLVFIPAAGEYVIPELLGPPEALLVGRVLWGEFFQNRDWPLAAALAVALLALLIVPIRLFQRLEDEGGSRPWIWTAKSATVPAISVQNSFAADGAIPVLFSRLTRLRAASRTKARPAITWVCWSPRNQHRRICDNKFLALGVRRVNSDREDTIRKLHASFRWQICVGNFSAGCPRLNSDPLGHLQKLLIAANRRKNRISRQSMQARRPPGNFAGFILTYSIPSISCLNLNRISATVMANPQDFEKLGIFYLGKEFDRASDKADEGLLLYESKDLTTHGVCVGMTGSGQDRALSGFAGRSRDRFDPPRLPSTPRGIWETSCWPSQI